MEQKRFLGNTTGRRPGDVTFQRWVEAKALVTNVAVTVRLEDPCNWSRSMANMTQALRTLNTISVLWYLRRWELSTMKGEGVLRQLFRFAGREFTSCGRAGLECRAIFNGLFRKLF